MNRKTQGKENFEWGHEAERLAAEYLITKGYTVRERNWRVGKTIEIDIIAEIGTRVVFVEVKTRAADVDEAIDAVDDKKMRKMAKGADIYLSSFIGLRPYRFDIIAFTGTRENHTMQHFEDAFLAPLDGLCAR